MTQVQQSKASVFNLWASMAESADWSEPTWAQQSVEQPEIVALGSHKTGEMFAVLDVDQRRVVTEDELPSWEIERMEWRKLS